MRWRAWLPRTTDQLANISGFGQITIVAYYEGDGNFAGNHGSGSVTVVSATATSLRASPTVALEGQTVQLSAVVTATAPVAGTPTGGSIAFDVYDGNGTLVYAQSVPINGDGAASTSFSLANSGTYSVTATYTGDASSGQPASEYASSSAVLGTGARILTVAGTGSDDYTGDRGPAQSATIGQSWGLAVDTRGDLFIADSENDAIREVDLSASDVTLPDGTTLQSGQIGTVVTGVQSIGGQNGPDGAQSIAVDSLGNLYIADTGANEIRVVNLTAGPETLDGAILPVDGIATIAGDGNANYSGDNGPASLAELAGPTSIAVDRQGDVFIADFGNNAIREIAAPFATSTVTLADGDRLSPGTIITIAGGPNNWGDPTTGVPATQAVVGGPTAIAVDQKNNVLYLSDQSSGMLRAIDLTTGLITQVPLVPPPVYAENNIASIGYANGLAVDDAGNVYYADSYNDAVLEYHPVNGTTTVVAGQPGQGGYYPGDNQPVTLSMLAFPAGLAVGPSGAVYIADQSNDRIRAVEPPSPLQILPATDTSTVTSASLNAVASQSPNFTLQSPDAGGLTNLIGAINGIAEPTNNGAATPVTVTVDLAPDTNYNDADISLQPGITLVIVGNGTQQHF